MDVTGLRVEQVRPELVPVFLVEPPGWTRLEPQSVSGDPTPGLEARVHDPLWLLFRQWQLGEFQGEDIGSPVSVQVATTVAPVVGFQSGDPAEARAPRPWADGELMEPVVERELTPDGWPGLRQRAEAGAQLIADLRDSGAPPAVRHLVVAGCPLAMPWDDPRDLTAGSLLTLLAGRVPDGEKAALQIAASLAGSPPALPSWFDSIGDQTAVIAAVRAWYAWYRGNVSPLPDPAADGWLPDRLEYRFSLAVAGVQPGDQQVLRAPSFAGGRVDWFDVDHDAGAAPLAFDGPMAAPVSRTTTLLATPLRFAGMPADRYWEFEDGSVNLGALQVQPHDLARLALVEFAMVFGSDWLVLPVDVPYGALVTVDSVTVSTTFGETVVVPSVDDSSRSGRFRLFELAEAGGAESLRALFVPPAAPAVIEGQPYEEVLFTRDEMANMAWAIERVIQGPSGDPRSRGDEPAPPPFVPSTDVGADMDYVLENEVPDRWIPLLPVSTGYGTIALRKGAMVKQGAPVQPLGVLLTPGKSLVVQDEEVPREGVRVRRVPVLARRADGSRVRWVTRRVDVGRGESSSGLAFDTAVRRAPTSPTATGSAVV